MFNNDGSSPTLTKCTFSSNSATGIGQQPDVDQLHVQRQ
jgi:hypothetical protein